MRTIIDIPSEQLSELDRWANSQQISRAQAVRTALSDLLARVNAPKHAGFGLWAQGGAIPPEQDGLAIERSLRDEWPE
jgi:hypothetical protein